jgi:hypothetical protein
VKGIVPFGRITLARQTLLTRMMPGSTARYKAKIDLIPYTIIDSAYIRRRRSWARRSLSSVCALEAQDTRVAIGRQSSPYRTGPSGAIPLGKLTLGYALLATSGQGLRIRWDRLSEACDRVLVSPELPNRLPPHCYNERHRLQTFRAHSASSGSSR